MKQKITAEILHNELLNLQLDKLQGEITFNLAGVSVKIDTTDTVGITLQSWLKQYMTDNNIFFSEPVNTQEFPDFFLDNTDANNYMLEIKAFNYNATPAFDIANFESYCSSVKEKPYRLNADYLIFGYVMDQLGNITIKKVWLHKIWQIAGTSQRFALKTQVKRDMIYNIRPNTDFKRGKGGPFNSKDDFLFAIYQTLIVYKGLSLADSWKNILAINYKKYFGNDLPF